MKSHPDRYPIGPRGDYPPYLEARGRFQKSQSPEDYRTMVVALKDWDRKSLEALAPKICEILRNNGGPMTLTELRKAYPPVREHLGQPLVPGFALELPGLRIWNMPGRSYCWQAELTSS